MYIHAHTQIASYNVSKAFLVFFVAPFHPRTHPTSQLASQFSDSYRDSLRNPTLRLSAHLVALYCDLQNKWEISTVFNGWIVPVCYWNSVGAIPIYFASRSITRARDVDSVCYVLSLVLIYIAMCAHVHALRQRWSYKHHQDSLRIHIYIQINTDIILRYVLTYVYVITHVHIRNKQIQT